MPYWVKTWCPYGGTIPTEALVTVPTPNNRRSNTNNATA